MAATASEILNLREAYLLAPTHRERVEAYNRRVRVRRRYQVHRVRLRTVTVRCTVAVH